MSLIKIDEWRLPTIDEMSSNFNRELGKSKIGGFSADFYWSSTTYSFHKQNAWYMFFYNGSIYYGEKDRTNCARCVRDKSYGLEWSDVTHENLTWEQATKLCKELN